MKFIKITSNHEWRRKMAERKEALEIQIEERIEEAKDKKILELSVGILVLEGKLGHNVLHIGDDQPLVNLDDQCGSGWQRDLKELQREIIPRRLQEMIGGHLDYFTEPRVWYPSEEPIRGKTRLLDYLDISIETLRRDVQVPYYYEGEYDFSLSGKSLYHSCEIKDIYQDIVVYEEEYYCRGVDDPSALYGWRGGIPERDIKRYIPAEWTEQLSKAFKEKCMAYLETYKRILEKHDKDRIEFLLKEEAIKKQELELELKERYCL